MSHKEIDWPGLRAAAVAIGIRKAARQAARDLPPDEQERFVQRAMKRCSREKWLVKAQQDKADAIVMSSTALSANVRKGADVLSELLAEDSRETSIGLSAATRKASVSLAECDGDEVVYVSAKLKDVVSSAAQLHGWNQPAAVNVNIANIPMPTEEERAEMRALDAKLDAFAKLIKTSRPKAA